MSFFVLVQPVQPREIYEGIFTEIGVVTLSINSAACSCIIGIMCP